MTKKFCMSSYYIKRLPKPRLVLWTNWNTQLPELWSKKRSMPDSWSGSFGAFAPTTDCHMPSQQPNTTLH